MAYIATDELGRFIVFTDNDEPYAGPYDTPEAARAAHPEVDDADDADDADED